MISEKGYEEFKKWLDNAIAYTLQATTPLWRGKQEAYMWVKRELAALEDGKAGADSKAIVGNPSQGRREVASEVNARNPSVPTSDEGERAALEKEESERREGEG